MRGRSLLRETSCSSICAFCAYRLKEGPATSKVSRRFLQSSHRASVPPAIATAALASNEESELEYAQSASGSTQNWENGSNSRPASMGGFGRRPAFGMANASTQGPSSSEWATGAFGNRRIELTEEEKRARDLVNEGAEKQERRKLVNVYPTPGPESSRAGRPVPLPIKAIKAAESRKQRALDLEQMRKEAVQKGPIIRRMYLPNNSSSARISDRSSAMGPASNSQVDYQVNSGPTIRRTLTSDSTPADSLNRSSATESASSSQDYSRAIGHGPIRWSHLRRRAEPTTDTPLSSAEDGLPQDRAHREEPTKRSDYVPIRSRAIAIAGQGVNLEGNDRKSSGRDVEPSDDFTGSARRFEDSIYPGKIPTSADIPPASTFKPIRADLEERQQLLEKQGRVRAGNFISEETSRFHKLEEGRKGRERDRSRRREQFSSKYDQCEQDEEAARAKRKKQRIRDKAARKAAAPTPLFLPEYISVANLAAVLKVRIENFTEKMRELGFEETAYDYILNGENAGLIAMEYNFDPFIDREESEDIKARPTAKEPSTLPPRPPVVTIMGHVDHGKTTLLDYLRKSSVAATEHGGITQHIGAFSVRMSSGKLVTFLDTPGHAAFLSMRQRGADVTDMVVLVVAADDSVKPQTIEAINHAKAAKVPVIVAINKVDKDEANIDRVKQDLARHNIEIEDFGGDTQVVCVSGKTGQGMEDLEETVVTLSEILDIRAERDGQVEGWVLETSIKSMGKVATVLIRRGTLRPGDFIVAGNTWARIRCLRNEAGVEILEAGPGTPVQIDGWKEQPIAGDEVLQAPNESKAKRVVEYRLEKGERERLAEDMKAINETRKLEQEKRERDKKEATLAEAWSASSPSSPETMPEESRGPKMVYFIIKGDVSGSVEAVTDSISSISSAEVQPHILRAGVGRLSEFDVEHAAASKGYLVNFNTAIDPKISQLANAAKVKIIDRNIIYRLVDDVKATLSEYLPPLITHRVLGEAEIVQVFDITIRGRQHKPIAGCKVRNGIILKNSKVRVLRDGEKIFDGTLSSLKNVKKDIMETRKGSECGIGFEGWNDFQVGDQVQCYDVKEEKRSL